MFSFRNFMVLCLVFHLLSHFDFIFIYGVRVSSTFIGLHVAVQLSQVVPRPLAEEAAFFPLYILASFIED